MDEKALEELVEALASDRNLSAATRVKAKAVLSSSEKKSGGRSKLKENPGGSETS